MDILISFTFSFKIHSINVSAYQILEAIASDRLEITKFLVQNNSCKKESYQNIIQCLAGVLNYDETSKAINNVQTKDDQENAENDYENSEYDHGNSEYDYENSEYYQVKSEDDQEKPDDDESFENDKYFDNSESNDNGIESTDQILKSNANESTTSSVPIPIFTSNPTCKTLHMILFLSFYQYPIKSNQCITVN